jgi:hypothetical protein
MPVGDELEGTALRKDCSFIVDRAVLETEEQSGGNLLAPDGLGEVTCREHAAFFRTQYEKAVDSSLNMAHGYGLSWRTRVQSTDQRYGDVSTSETLCQRTFHAFYDG